MRTLTIKISIASQTDLETALAVLRNQGIKILHVGKGRFTPSKREFKKMKRMRT